MVNNKRFVFIIFFGLFLVTAKLFSIHNSNRYFPFLEKPQIIKRGNFGTAYPSFFYISDPNAFNDNWDSIGIHELYGKYDLKDVINSLKAVRENVDGETFVNPFISIAGPAGAKFVDKSIKYDLDGSIKAFGFALNYEQSLPLKNTFIGAFIPFMHVVSNQTFKINEKDTSLGFSLTSPDKVLIDRARRLTHSSIGFQTQDFVKSGFGDLDLYLRGRMEWDYLHMMRGISANLKIGAILPIGEKRDVNNPASIPFMSNGHAGLYIDYRQEFELKEDWRLGCTFAFLGQFSSSETERLTIGNEPLPFSALKGPMQVRPGVTVKFAPYFSLGNLTDGLSLQLRYTHLRHDEDKVVDRRSAEDRQIQRSNLSKAEDLTRWRLNMLSFQATYDSSDADKDWALKPIIYAIYDWPFNAIGGKNAAKHHQFTLGVELNF